MCVYIYTHARKSKLGPKLPFGGSKLGQFFLCWFFKNMFCRENEITKTEDKQKLPFLSQTLVQLCCASYLDQVLTQPWTKL